MSRTINLVEAVENAIRVFSQAEQVPELKQQATNLLYDARPLYMDLRIKLQEGTCRREDADQLIAMLPIADHMAQHMHEAEHGALEPLF